MPTQTRSRPSPVRRVAHYNDRKLEMQWITDHGDACPGEWVALNGDRLLAHGMDAKTVFAEARKTGVAKPLFAHLEPDNPKPQCGGWCNLSAFYVPTPKSAT
jgi:hypothetical protein